MKVVIKMVMIGVVMMMVIFTIVLVMVMPMVIMIMIEHGIIVIHCPGGPIQPTSPTDCWTEPEATASPRHNHSHSDSGISSMSGRFSSF